MITGLGYIGICTTQPAEWEGYATRLLGMQRVDAAGGTQVFRMDDRAQRLVVTPEADDGLAFLGWEVPDAAALDTLAARLERAGVRVSHGGAALAAERHVRDLLVFHDPAGNRLEAFHGQEIADTPFVPGRPLSGFRTGPLGMGHVVLHVADAQALAGFYRDTLGFGLSDFGRTPYDLFFFHVNGRHHSFAMVGSGSIGIHHFMVELGSLDDVGQGYDLAMAEAGRVAYSLGRHTNDWMTSFYTTTPSGFFVEYGWGGRVIDPSTWQPHETFDGPSYWGHERLHLPEGGARERLRAMRMDAAARGLRAPDPQQPATGCAWADAAIRATQPA